MWYEDNYRRIFLDMHINDDRDEYLANVDPKKLVGMLHDAGAQMIVVKCRPHTGLAHFPTKIGRMHRGLHGRDYVGEMVEECHKYGIAAKAYFSQIFDNYAYENHPEWRMINGFGKTSREEENYGATSMFRSGRYGIVCPNNEEYRQYVNRCLTELLSKYQFETIFLDMPFWPEVCYCSSCRKKYHEATGRELPRKVDWSDKDFREFQYLREKWMGEFAALSTAAVKAAQPSTTVEHNMAVASAPWQQATSDLVNNACDYTGGDLYGGLLEESFICKYYKHLTKALPFVYITSRCDPNLQYHTTTKTADEFLLQGIVALAHNGALSICDGANPDGTLCEDVYSGPVRAAFDISRKYERFVNGDIQVSVAVWFPSHSKYDWKTNGDPVTDSDNYRSYSDDYLKQKLAACDVMRMANIPFDVIPSKKLGDIPGNMLLVSNVCNILDEEMNQLEYYIRNGGTVYLSGHIGHQRLWTLLECEPLGTTQHNVTYMTPTATGNEWLPGFSASSPLALQSKMERFAIKGDCDVLATMTLPYTMTCCADFSAIHSNPPGIHTKEPALILKRVGKGMILYANAPIEACQPLMSREAFAEILRKLSGKAPFTSNAPGWIEVVGWEKDGKQYFIAMNEQERAPYMPISEVTITANEVFTNVMEPATGELIPFEVREGKTIINLPKFTVFKMVVCN
jgi:hypothetical protein